MPESPTFETLARQLHAGPAESFVARRKEAVAAARATGDRELARRLAALRRPTAAAAVVNALPDEELDAVWDLASRLRAATSGLRVDDLRSLSAERSQLIGRIVDGVEVSASVREEVRGTLLAALADPRAEAAVRSRTLVRALSYAGFGEVEIDGVTATPSEPATPAAPDTSADPGCSAPPPQQPSEPATRQGRLSLVPSEKLLEEARRAVEVAERRVAGAQAAADAAQAALAAATQGLDAARERLRGLEEGSPGGPTGG